MLNKSYKSYNEFSQIYDLLMDDVNYEKWTSFIINRVNKSEGKKILEAACGTGSITRLLTVENYKITAFDLSQDMLMRAYEKLGRNPCVKLLNLDMVDFKINDMFDAAICCCDGINYLDKNQISMFFNNIYNHLNNNSMFIFDMSTEYKFKSMFNDTYVYDDGEVFYVWENEMDESDHTVNMEINFFVRDATDKYTRINEIQTQYIHTLEMVISKLIEAGFKHVETYDDYSDEKLNEKSLRTVFCATKK